MRSITEILKNFKQGWRHQLDETDLESACRDTGMQWIDSMLNPVMTLQLFFLQVLYGNTACQHLSHLSGLPFTAAAYCVARGRISLDALELLLARNVGQLQEDAMEAGRWLGHRVFLMDGSSFSMADTPDLQSHFGQPGAQQPGCGFPVAHWLAMMHMGTGAIAKMLASPMRTHDMSKSAQLHPELRPGDVVVNDRGFCSFAHFALLYERGVHGVMRIHQKTIVDFTPGRPHATPGKGKSKNKKGLPRSRWMQSLGQHDQIVQWLKPTSRPRWMTVEQFQSLPNEILIRELRFEIHRKGFRVKQITLATTLVDSEIYFKELVADLYRRRWEIETNFGHIKTTMGMDVLKCKTVDGVLRELHMFALVYNLIRQLMLEASIRQGVDMRRISFIDTLRWLQSSMFQPRPIRIYINPDRPDRYEPRVRKRRPKQYPLMTKPRRLLKQRLAAE